MSLPQKRASITSKLISELDVPNPVLAELAAASQPLMTLYYIHPTSDLDSEP